MKTLNALLTVVAAALVSPAFGQVAGNVARPGTLNYVEGQASVDGRQVSAGSVGSVTLGPGQYLATGNGKAELLLTPGIFLRLDNNSTVQMVHPDLTHTEVRLEQGRASVEADQLMPQNTILIDQKGGQTQLLKNGLYTFNADNNTVRTFDGKAAVFPGDNLNSNVKPIDVKGGKQLTLTGEAVKPVGFDKDHAQDDLYKWSSLRSEYLGNANVDLAAQYAGYSSFNPGWYWDSSLYAYDWLPGNGLFWSPFGYGFYSPYYIGGGGFVYGRGFYGRGFGYRGGYGFSGARAGYGGFRGGYAGGGARSAGFAGAGGGFHGGGGGGGFHGGGGGGGHR